jgi:hypothetical protein
LVPAREVETMSIAKGAVGGAIIGALIALVTRFM